jgi:lipoprotein NlpD
MMLNPLTLRILAVILVLLTFAGCRASGNFRAPIEGRGGRHAATDDRDTKKSSNKSMQAESDPRAQIYVVQKGDTLFSIAFENGLDYRELAEKNKIENPAAIQIGQQIRLFPAEENINERFHIESKALADNSPAATGKKDQPKIYKLPYSEQALAKIEKLQQEQGTQSAVIPLVVAKPLLNVKPVPEPNTSDDSLDWGMPTKGKVISEYSEGANRKGIDISGIRGQAILASEAGTVVYSGSGLRGYGKLVIIKHNKTYLSAYAHNEQLLVKEGQSVVKGQKIAEMGSTDSDQVKLHFEIRKLGKPVDPAKFLNLSKS